MAFYLNILNRLVFGRLALLSDDGLHAIWHAIDEFPRQHNPLRRLKLGDGLIDLFLRFRERGGRPALANSIREYRPEVLNRVQVRGIGRKLPPAALLLRQPFNDLLVGRVNWRVIWNQKSLRCWENGPQERGRACLVRSASSNGQSSIPGPW